MTEERRLKVVQINAVYGKGSTGSITQDIHQFLLREGHESFVFAADQNDDVPAQEKNGLRQVGNHFDHSLHAILWRILKNQGWNSRLATRKMCREIKTISPDVVHLHNLHSNFANLGILLKFLAAENFPVVLTLHDCWFFTGGCFHFLKHHECEQWQSKCGSCPQYMVCLHKKTILSQFMKKKVMFAAIQRLSVIGVSEWISSCAKVSAILRNATAHQVIYNWIDESVFHPMDTRQTVAERLGIDVKRKIVLGVSQGWSDDKGLCEFEAIASNLSGEVAIVLVGNPNGHQSTDTIKFVGYTKNVGELAQLYAAADVFVNPSKMETFGKVTVEALACGTPVVCYNNTGTKELVTSDVGALVQDGDMDELIRMVRVVINRGKASFTSACRKWAVREFSKKAQLGKYVAAYKAIVGKWYD